MLRPPESVRMGRPGLSGVMWAIPSGCPVRILSGLSGFIIHPGQGMFPNRTHPDRGHCVRLSVRVGVFSTDKADRPKERTHPNEENTPMKPIRESLNMTIKRIRASVTHTGNFGPRVQSRETSKALTLHELGVTKPKTRGMEKVPGVLGGKALAKQLLAEEDRRG